MDRRGAKRLLLLILGAALAPPLSAQGPSPQPAPFGPAGLMGNTLPPPTLLPSTPDNRPPQLSDAQVPWTLDRLEAIADAYNPILPRDRAAAAAAKGSALQAGLWANPRFDTNNPQVINGRNSALNVGFQQEIPVMGKKRLDQASSTEVAKQAEITFHQDRFALQMAIRQQFYTVLVDQRRIEVLTELVEILNQAYQAGVKRMKASDLSRSEVLLLLIDLQRTQAQLRSAQALLVGDRKQLGAIVGIPGLVTREVSGQVSGNYPDYSEEWIRRYILERHTQVQYARSVIEQNKYALRRAEVEPFPNPYLGPSYQYGLVPGFDQFWFNIQFSIPVWDRNQGNIRAARGNLVAAQENLITIQNNLLNQGANLLSQYRAALAIVRQFEVNVLPNTRETVRLAYSGYSQGLYDFNTYLQVQRTLIQANSDYLDALQNLWTNAVQIAGLLQQEKFPEPAGLEGLLPPGNCPPPGSGWPAPPASPHPAEQWPPRQTAPPPSQPPKKGP
jgi:cobalt-zinc-cadmium efflux system outer membrane protein